MPNVVLLLNVDDKLLVDVLLVLLADVVLEVELVDDVLDVEEVLKIGILV